MTDKHPLRCETCKKYPVMGIISGDCPQKYILPYDWGVSIDIWATITSMTGCASHSDARSADDVCESFVPNKFYRKSKGSFCVEKFCQHWKPEKRKCIDFDPAAGSTYSVEEAHCEIRKGGEG